MTMPESLETDAQSAERIVVVGASAGGVTAFLKLAAALPARFAAPIVFVQHIGAHPSRLASLVDARGPNEAVEVRDGQAPRPGTIHIAPSDHHVLVEHGRLRLSLGPKENHARPAIDPLFRTAALSFGPRAIGVILTGTLDDGSAGLRAIRECGGIAVVQDPADAHEPGMPASALAAAGADHVVPLSELAALLTALVAEEPRTHAMPEPPQRLRREHAVSVGDHAIENLQAIGAPSTFTCPDCGGVLFELHDRRPVRFRCHTGHAFSLQSLAHSQDLLTDEALWTALRALQEKEAGLRRLAEVVDSDRVGARQEAEKLARVSAALRALVLYRE